MDDLISYEERVEKDRRAKYGATALAAGKPCSSCWNAYIAKSGPFLDAKDVFLMKAIDKILRAAEEDIDVVTTDHYADARIYIKLAHEAALHVKGTDNDDE